MGQNCSRHKVGHWKSRSRQVSRHLERVVVVSLLLLRLPISVRGQDLPLVPAGKVLALTPKAGYFNEPSIAINSRNPKQLIAAYQVNATVTYSEDAGQNWTLVPNVAPPDYKISGDVSVTYDAHGHAILCYIAFDKLGTENYWAKGATRNGIFIKRSLNGGRTWESAAIPIIAQPTKPGIPFEDKPYIVADNTNSSYAGNLYIGWTEFTLTKSVILFSRSTDGGRTWSVPFEISSHEGLPRDDNGSVEGFSGVVAPDGTLYVVWADGNTIMFTRSRDGGVNFERSHKIVEVAPPYFEVTDVSRANGFPEIGISPGHKKGEETLYVVWSDYRNRDVHVFCATSRTHGKSWSRAVRVNSDPVHNGNDQFFQWLAVDPRDGSANIIFYDRRDDPENLKTTVTLARSTDGGKSFINYAWTHQPFVSKRDFIGDYTGIAAFGGHVYGIWAEEAPKEALPDGKGSEPSNSESESKQKRATVVKIGASDFGMPQ